MMTWNKVLAWMVAVALLACTGGAWADPGHNLTDEVSHLIGMVILFGLVLLILAGAAAYALFWENVLETRVQHGLAMIQNRPVGSGLTGLIVAVGVILLGKASEGAPALGGLVVALLVVSVWILSIGMICFARWLGRRLFAESAHRSFATAKGMVIILLMGLLFPIGLVALLLLALCGLGAMILSWRSPRVLETRPMPEPMER